MGACCRKGVDVRTVPAILVLLVVSAVPLPAADPPADDVTRRLIAALRDPDVEVRQNLAVALAKIGPSSVELLVDALKDPAAERRSGAAYALALIGPPARSAVPALIDALSDKDVDVRRQVSYAISRLVPTGKPPGLGIASRTLPASPGGRP
jgi:hypothetical protein